MAVQYKKDKLPEALDHLIINARLVNWLWFYFKHFHPQLDIGEFKSSGINNRMAEFISNNPEIQLKINHLKSAHFLPDTNLYWITSDKRQQYWINQHLIEKIVSDQRDIPNSLIGRDRIFAIIDAWFLDLNSKAIEIKNIEIEWDRHKQADRIFQWFDGADEKQKCTLAWELTGKKYPNFIAGKDSFNTLQELLIFFDHTGWHEAEKALLIKSIKNRWSQNKYRANITGKKQYNFILSNKAIGRLDKLANEHNLKRVEILEILLEMEDKKGTHIQEKQNLFTES